MKLYEKYYASNYKELITYYPRYYRDVFEMVEILKAFGRIADGLEDNIEQTYLNNFILTADAETIAVWEGLLEITYEESLTLDQRRAVVIARLMGYGHIGEPEIRAIIAKYTEEAVAVDFGGGVIYIVINGEVFDETNLLNTLLRRIPAHLALDMKVRIERTFRQQLDVSFGGATGGYFRPEPVGEDRTARTQLYAGYGGRVEADFNTDTIRENRTSRIGLDVAHGAFLKPEGTGTQPEVKKSATGRTEAAGGMYYHTHTKSKLIG